MDLNTELTNDLEHPDDIDPTVPVSKQPVDDKPPVVQELLAVEAYAQLKLKSRAFKDSLAIKTSLESMLGFSKDMAMILESHYHDFLNERRVIQQFTASPSKTGKHEADYYLKNKLAQEAEGFAKELKMFFEEPLEDILLFQHHFKKYYRDYFSNEFFMLKTYYTKFWEEYEDCPHLLVTVNGKGENLLDLGLTALSKAEISADSMDTTFGTKIKYAASAMEKAVKSAYLMAFLHNGGQADYAAHLTMSDVVLTLRELLPLITSEVFQDGIAKLEAQVDAAVEEMKTLSAEITELKDPHAQHDFFVSENAERFENAVKTAEFAESVVRHGMTLIAGLQVMVKTLNEVVQ